MNDNLKIIYSTEVRCKNLYKDRPQKTMKNTHFETEIICKFSHDKTMRLKK